MLFTSESTRGEVFLAAAGQMERCSLSGFCASSLPPAPLLLQPTGTAHPGSGFKQVHNTLLFSFFFFPATENETLVLFFHLQFEHF